jgi:hypothetical protein
MRNFGGNPASSAACQTGAMMTVVAAGTAALFDSLQGIAQDLADQRYERSYIDALSRAKQHSRQLQTVAEFAITRVGELEAEVAALRAACAQRQEVVDMLMGRA